MPCVATLANICKNTPLEFHLLPFDPPSLPLSLSLSSTLLCSAPAGGAPPPPTLEPALARDLLSSGRRLWRHPSYRAARGHGAAHAEAGREERLLRRARPSAPTSAPPPRRRGARRGGGHRAAAPPLPLPLQRASPSGSSTGPTRGAAPASLASLAAVELRAAAPGPWLRRAHGRAEHPSRGRSSSRPWRQGGGVAQ